MIFVLFIVIALLVVYMIIVYNQLVKNRNRMQEAWSIIDVFLKKRSELVPNLVETVKGYSAHEQKLLEEVTRLRSQTIAANDQPGRISTENNLAVALNKLLVTVEAYPILKANEHFLKLQQQLTEIENELEMARRYYNGTVRQNNIALESFPSNIIGNLFSFCKGIFFSSEGPGRDTPEISF